MDAYTAQALVDLGSSLAVLAAKGTASAVATKVKAIKGDKDAASVRAAYDELVNELLEERSETLRIAQAYKAEFERVVLEMTIFSALMLPSPAYWRYLFQCNRTVKNHPRLTQRRLRLTSLAS